MTPRQEKANADWERALEQARIAGKGERTKTRRALELSCLEVLSADLEAKELSKRVQVQDAA